MKETHKTLAFAGIAALLAALAIATTPRVAVTDPALVDQGQPFYPDFKDQLAARQLEVVEYDEGKAVGRAFKVEFREGRWVIPSHHNYPADAKERLKKVAAEVMDLRKDVFRSDNPAHHGEFGVIDPQDASASTSQGRGRRVTLRDGEGRVLCDYIFGKDAGEGKKFVRLPGQKRVYATKTKAEISTKFADWIETDLLQLSQWSIRKIAVDRYSIDERQRILNRQETYLLSRKDSSANWEISEMPADQEPNAERINEVLTALDDLKIAGVRAKPEKLREMATAKGELRMKRPKTPQERVELELALQSLVQKGFWPVLQQEEVQLLSNEGEMVVSCDDGIATTLRFGEIVVGEDEEITAGQEEKKESGKEGNKAGTEHRYLMVSVKFDETLLGEKPVEPAAPPGHKPDEKSEEKKEEPGKQESPEVEKYKKDKEEYDRRKKDYDKKLEDGKKRAQELTNRFAEWYYVISNDLFQKLRRPRADLHKPREKKEEEKKPGDKPN